MNEETAVVKRENPIERLKQYIDDPRYCVTLPLDGVINVSPYIAMDLIPVKIDPRDVKEGGEVHDIHGAFMPSAPAIFRLCDAWGIQVDAEKSETKLIGEYHWCTKVSGRRRNPDGSWRQGYAEYEFNANLRGKKSPTQLFDFQNHGRTRCVTGAELALIRKLTGMKTGFKTREELQVSFIAYRFVDDVAAISRDPAMREGLIKNGNQAAGEIYGQPRDVTPVVVENGVMVDKSAEEVPAEFADLAETEKPIEDNPLETAQDCIEDWLATNELPARAKDIIRLELMKGGGLGKCSLELLQKLINRCTTYRDRVKAEQAGGSK